MFHNWKWISYTYICLLGHGGTEKLGVGDPFPTAKHDFL